MVYLEKIKKIDIKNMAIYYEKIINNLILVEIFFRKKESYGRIFYWSLNKSNDIPPMEIGIELNTGEITSIKFYLTYFQEKKINQEFVEKIEGNIIVKTEVFTGLYLSRNYNNYEFFLDENELICVLGLNNEFKYCYINKNFKIYTNYKEQVVGFSIDNLKEDEIELIKSVKEI